MTKKTITAIFATLLLSILIAGCMPGAMAYSPQEAALNSLAQQGDPSTVVDQASVIHRQTLQMGSQAFVLVSYSARLDQQQNTCFSVFQVERNGLGGWVPRSSGGGCSGVAMGEEEQPQPPVQSGSGTNTGNNPADPGTSYAYGLVSQADIAKIRVTWSDGQVQEAAVVNGSYLTFRKGDVHFQKIEGLNANGDVTYTSESITAPEKQ